MLSHNRLQRAGNRASACRWEDTLTCTPLSENVDAQAGDFTVGSFMQCDWGFRGRTV